MKSNLQQFWSCCPSTGASPEIFRSRWYADAVCLKYLGQVNAQHHFYWETGDKGSLAWKRVENSTYGTVLIPDECNYPTSVIHHPAGSETSEDWATCKGFELVEWGELAE